MPVPAHAPSPEFDELLSRRPPAAARWGTAVILSVLGIAIGIAALLPYPQVSVGTATVTTRPLPLELKVPAAGRVGRVFVRSGDSVGAGAPVLELENNTGYDTYRRLLRLCDSVPVWMATRNVGALRRLPDGLDRSGDLQPAVNAVLDAAGQWQLLAGAHIFDARAAALRQQATGYTRLTAEQRDELRLIEDELAQAAERFDANAKLYSERIISKTEYFEEAARLRARQLQLKASRRAALQNDLSLTENRREATELQYSRQEKELGLQASLAAAVRALQAGLQAWALRYLVVMPGAGRVVYTKPLVAGQTLAAGEAVLAAIPPGARQMAVAWVPSVGVGKVRPGQPVQLRLDAFPYQEFGALQGRVQAIGAIPERSGPGSGYTYRVVVDVPDPWVTTTGRRLPFAAERPAQARILLGRQTVLQRLLGRLRAQG